MTNWWVLIAPGVLAVLAVGAVVWKAGAWYNAVNTDRATFKEFMKEVREELKEVREELREIRQHLTRVFQRLPVRTTADDSPVRLTDLGQTIADELTAREWARSLAPTLLPTIVGTRPYEVDEFADHHVTDDLPEDWRVRVAECAYEHGLQRDQVLAVLRVVLRDELLRIGNFPSPKARSASS